MHSYKNQKAFTIVELLVVIVVIGILASIGIVSYNGIQERAIAASISVDLQNVAKGIELDTIQSGSHYNPTVLSKYITTEGSQSVVSYEYGDRKFFCLEAVSLRQDSIVYHIDTRNGLNKIAEGECPPASGEATTRCVVGNVAVTVRQANDTDETLIITSTYDATTTSTVSPGGQHSYATNLRQPSVDAGIATVYMKGAAGSSYEDVRYYAHQPRDCS